MRLVVAGRSSFIAQHIRRAADELGVPALFFQRVDDMTSGVRPDDTVLNCSLHPNYRSGPYREEEDMDLQCARVASEVGARTVMLSTRRVYPKEIRWGARENNSADGDETAYGKNKARSEAAIRSLGSSSLAILRLSNIFGYEFAGGGMRRTFLAQLARTLKNENIIRFDMHPDTQRDFLPVEICAAQILRCVADGVSGTYNLGSGFPTRCGDLADWIVEGFGRGRIDHGVSGIKDEFFLNMDAWTDLFGSRPIEPDSLKSYCVQLGRKLKCESS